ncbi:P-loop containing nucleoside triphosphate hydrolase protein [Athelia psychrophila]|uniref:P-loop containing nucleoside triphosphate hydrolase protein n=1 Tax=Athelia psychrophila TaxID=1759441 RepID=A0A166FFW2_9AGAM|nr:P-loop containing nucleoside triphosphate hydrolase protein [Fibularhizoctonia sp. CBS 109695]
MFTSLSTSGIHVLTSPSIWHDSLLVPAYISAASAALLIIHVIHLSKPAKRLYALIVPNLSLGTTELSGPELEQGIQPATFFGQVRAHIAIHGGGVIYTYKVVRLIGCLALLGLSIATFILEETGQIHFMYNITGKWGKKHPKRNKKHAGFTNAEWVQVALCVTSAYSFLLSLVSVSARPRWGRLASNHLAVVLLALFGVYVHRDLWPLATFTKHPVDHSEGWILWAKAGVLFIISIVVPLFMPRQYTPVDPAEPSLEPAPEQTASIISLALWFFLDPIVFQAYRIPHLSHDQLPPIADYDRAKYLVKTGFPHLDLFSGSKKRHIFFGLMHIYRVEYTVLAFMQILRVLALLASPIGINQLLQYLENRGEGAVVRPWVWIIWLFLAPITGTVAMQWYTFIATRTLARTEGLITQLIFNHALRIRMKAELPEGVSSTSSTAVGTPDNASVIDQPVSAEASESSNGSGAETPAQSSSSFKSTSSKSKQKGRDVPNEKAAAPQKDADNLVGKIMNLISTDTTNITDARDIMLLLVNMPLLVGLSIWFLYVILGWSAFVGLAVMVLLSPLPGAVASMIQSVQVARMQKTDARVQNVTETMNVLRMIKLFGWETKMNAKIADKREEELKLIRKRQMLDLLNHCINFLIPIATMLATYATYTLIMKKDLTASKVFSSITVFDLLRENLHMVFWELPHFIQGEVSLDRVNDFLTKTELLDSFSECISDEAVGLISDEARIDNGSIGFRDAVFSWSDTTSGTVTPSRRQFTLRIADELFFKPGINLVIGPTGSGKSSLLMALLGEMHFVPSCPRSAFNLPRAKGVAYAAQESWVQNETIKENILFGSAYDEERYQQVIYQCGLSRDLELFEAGDLTEVGEKGLTLSGGQKARITLARAIYSPADILLLDDVLAALDVHTAKHIVEKCFSGNLIIGRTVILVTHNVAMASPIANFVVSLGIDGTVLSQGSVSDALAKNKTLLAEVIEDKRAMEKADQQVDSSQVTPEVAKVDGKLIVVEEINVGHISWGALRLFFKGLGGDNPIFFWIVFLGGLGATSLVNTAQTWWLGYWASQYDLPGYPTVNVPYYLVVYTILLLITMVLYSLSSLMFIFGSLRASRAIHESLLESVLGTTLRWLDQTPTSRVIARCTQDIRAVDGPIAQGFSHLASLSLTMLAKLVAIVWLTPVFVFPGIVVAFLGGWCGQIYIKAQLSVKREMSNAKSPVLGHFGAAIAGLVSIRAYGAQSAFKGESLVRIDKYTRAARTFYNLNRWVCVRIDTIGALFTASLATYLVYGRSEMPDASSTGFSLNMAVIFSSLILWWVRLLNNFEVQGNSLERIQAYVGIEQEPKPTVGGEAPAYWPASGDIRVEGLSARYSADGPKVLHDISFHVKSGERIGVVGRTGSGKSSLTLALLRCILTEGAVYYDGLPTHSLNLDALRSKITIIPQVPELLAGPLRQNLDPFCQYDDAILNDALRAAGLFSLQGEMEDGRITLDSPISAGGGNLSVGQRQILALARAIVRGSKLLILDEATSAIDYKTDNVIQTSLRKELGTDVTLITVAHRLQTIMDADKIMVLDAGRIAEFDSPHQLLQNEKGLLRALVDESGDKEHLYAMAEGKHMESA